jgi:hypothetical protein
VRLVNLCILSLLVAFVGAWTFCEFNPQGLVLVTATGLGGLLLVVAKLAEKLLPKWLHVATWIWRKLGRRVTSFVLLLAILLAAILSCTFGVVHLVGPPPKCELVRVVPEAGGPEVSRLKAGERTILSLTPAGRKLILKADGYRDVKIGVHPLYGQQVFETDFEPQPYLLIQLDPSLKAIIPARGEKGWTLEAVCSRGDNRRVPWQEEYFGDPILVGPLDTYAPPLPFGLALRQTVRVPLQISTGELLCLRLVDANGNESRTWEPFFVERPTNLDTAVQTRPWKK